MKSKFYSRTVSVLLCVLMCVFCGCSENKLKTAVEEANKKCPQSLGAVGEMSSVVYEDGMVVFNFTFDEDFIDIDAVSSNPDMMKTTVMTGMKNEGTNKLFELMVESDASLNLVFKGKTSGKEAKLTFTASEMKEELDKPMPTPEEKLKAAIASTNEQMPIDSGNGIIMTELVDKGDLVVYMAKVASKEQFKQIANTVNEIKNTQRSMFKLMNDPSLKIFFQLIADAGKGLGYSYYVEGNDNHIDVTFPNAELKELLGK